VKLLEKLQILADSAKYDVSCSSSGSSRGAKKGALGAAAMSGICHSWAADGRCISLLKVLFSNACVYDCAYCVNRVSNDIPRASFTADEMADLTMQFYRRNYIEGLFLSSAVTVSPDFTMERMVLALRKLREVHRFNGYIHVKAIPGADPALIHQAGLLADRMSVNIEVPSASGLLRLAPQKTVESVLEPMAFLTGQIQEHRELLPVARHAPAFVPAGQSTQLMVGATRDSDLRILRLSEQLYRRFSLKRVYYSAYMPVNEAPGQLPAVTIEPPLLREHRMYQADWLLRFYGFEARELLDEKHPSFDPRLDPKADWAVRHLDQFPVEINKASYDTLLRVPGIGVLSAKRILAARRFGPLTFADLERMRIVMRRARNFITCGGRFAGERGHSPHSLQQALAEPGLRADPRFEQMSLFGSGFHAGRTSLSIPEGIQHEAASVRGASGVGFPGMSRQGFGLPGRDAYALLPEESVPFFAEPSSVKLLEAAT
jgi:putative DNA modification/repair radical SAM protein